VSLVATSSDAELQAFLKAVRDSRLGSLISREVVEPADTVHVRGFAIED